jgi:DNA end-binding protein Ku
MPARAIGSATISFGLVSVPVKLYVATHSEQQHFNLLHKTCGSRIKQQVYCPKDERVVERNELVKGYEVERDHYVTFTDEELKALEAAASATIDIQEFVPLAKVDPIHFENAHYLGPDKGGDKAYHLLVEAMRETKMVAVAQHVSRGKEQLVLVRPVKDALVLHTLYYADEVRRLDAGELGAAPTVRPAEKALAEKLIAELAADDFHPEQYRDHYRDRLAEVIERKRAGEEITTVAAPAGRAHVIDLMDALKRSLAREGKRGGKASAPAVAVETAATSRRTGGRRRAAKK